ncbi:MAG TPA: hypothetical protein VIY28_18365 [Pseudonocardiaceae bacterium]
MGRHAAAHEPLHVVYVGSSADLGALRRLMEAHGAVTRTRLTPAVAVVVADSGVPEEHPTLRAAGTLGIPVMAPSEAISQFAGWRTRSEPYRPATNGAHPETNGTRRTWPFRRRDR